MRKEPDHWEGLEPNPWKTSAQQSDSGNGDSPSEDSEAHSTFGSEDPVDEQIQHWLEREGPNDEPHVEETTGDGNIHTADVGDSGQARQRAAVSAFQTVVSEACKEAETQLTSVVEKMRKTAAEEHAAEIVQITDRHAEELQQTRETVEAEMSERVRQEEAQRHAAEVAHVREELERQYARDLQSTKTAVVDSFNELTKSVLRRL